MRVVLVGKLPCHVLAAAAPVRDQLAENNGWRLYVDHPEPWLERRQRVVDDREEPCVRYGTARERAVVCSERALQGLRRRPTFER